MDLLSAVLWLTLTVYHEARGEGYDGQRAVVNVILNRAENRDRSIKEVVLRPYQFSCYNAGVRMPKNPAVFLMVLGNVSRAIEEEDNTGGAMYYHSVTVEPQWAASYERTKKIGKHIFYKE